MSSTKKILLGLLTFLSFLIFSYSISDLYQGGFYNNSLIGCLVKWCLNLPILLISIGLMVYMLKQQISAKLFLIIQSPYILIDIICILGLLFYKPVGEDWTSLDLSVILRLSSAFLAVNILTYIVYRMFSRLGVSILITLYVIVAISRILYGVGTIKTAYEFDNTLYSHQQYAYRYKNNIYYINSNKKGIYEMTPQGVNTNLYDIQLNNQLAEKTFFAYNELLYFKINNVWNEINLDTKQITKNIVLSQEKKDYVYNITYSGSDMGSYIFGGAFKTIIKDEVLNDFEVTGDGYIYYSCFNDKGLNDGICGLYRVKLGEEKPQKLVPGNIGAFDIKNNIIYYNKISISDSDNINTYKIIK